MSLHHLALRTTSPARLAHFYQEVMGLVPLSVTDAGSHWLAIGSGAVLMIEQCAATEPAVPAGLMDFFALAVSATELAEFEARCAANCVAIEHRTEFTRYLRDPDGRRVGVSCYSFSLPPGC